MSLFNCHTHSCHSHDASGTIEEMINSAISGNLMGLAVTDHCDCEYSDNTKMMAEIEKSYNETKALSKKYSDKLIISAGIELGDALYAPGFAKRILQSYDWDVVLCSVHAVKLKNAEMPFSLIDFSSFDKQMLNEYINQYFDELYFTAKEYDYDILCHLTVIFRYIKYKFKINTDIMNYMSEIEKILGEIIRRNKVLEINISGYDDGYLMPDIEIIKSYMKLGGKKFSLGNDSHKPEDVVKNIENVHELLKSLGINKLIYFIDRQEYYYDI